MTRIAITVALISAASLGSAGPYLVEFEGAITEVADGAPDSFWVGERVAGAFVYDPEASPAYSVYQRFTTADTSFNEPLSGWPTEYESFPTDDPIDFLTQVWRGGDLAVETEGGFFLQDEALDLFWAGSSSDGAVATGSPLFFAGNSGYWLNKVVGEAVIDSSLVTVAGPQATALQINFARPTPEFVYDGQGVPEATLGSLAGPQRLVLLGGGFQFGPPDYTFASASTDVTFEIESFAIVAVPEPAAWLVLLGFSVTSWACRNRR